MGTTEVLSEADTKKNGGKRKTHYGNFMPWLRFHISGTAEGSAYGALGGW